MVPYNKKTDLKQINEVNQNLKKVFSNTFFLDNGWVIGDNLLEIGQHFAHINDHESGLFKFKSSEEIIKYDTTQLFKTISENKKVLTGLTKNSDTIRFFDTESGDSFPIGDIIYELPRKYKDITEVLYNNIPLLNNCIKLDEETIYAIYKNKHFVLIPTPMESVRVSKQLMPTIKCTAKEISDVYVYAIPSDNEYMFKVIFKVVTPYVTNYHLYMVSKTE